MLGERPFVNNTNYSYSIAQIAKIKKLAILDPYQYEWVQIGKFIASSEFHKHIRDSTFNKCIFSFFSEKTFLDQVLNCL